jgi:hypothetical protein
MVNQSITFHRPNKKVSEKTMAHSILKSNTHYNMLPKKYVFFIFLLSWGDSPWHGGHRNRLRVRISG